MTQITTYRAWDAGVRSFHWINLSCVLGLVAVGLAILNEKALGLDNDAKILLKTVHVWIGYVFVLNLVFRMVWASFGPATARWRRSEEHTSELQSQSNLVCRLLLEKKKKKKRKYTKKERSI